MTAEDHGGGSGLTQRELILEMRLDLKALLNRVEEKADRRALHAVEDRVDSLAQRVTTVEGDVRAAEAVAKGKASLLAAMVALVVMLVAVAGLLLRIGAG